MRLLNLSLFLTDYDLRPCSLMGPGGFLVGFAFIPSVMNHAYWHPDLAQSPFLWGPAAVIWLLALWMFVRGCLNSLSNSPSHLGELDGLFSKPTAQLLTTLPMLAGTLAGWHSVQTETFGLAILSGAVTLAIWFLGWSRILATRE